MAQAWRTRVRPEGVLTFLTELGLALLDRSHHHITDTLFSTSRGIHINILDEVYKTLNYTYLHQNGLGLLNQAK